MRKALNTDERTLDELVKSYYQNKLDLDSYDKICKDENAKIKAKMSEIDSSDYEVDGLVVKIIDQDRSSFNEEKLLSVAKSLNLDIIKTREYVDMDALESLIYNGKLSKEDMLKLNECKEEKIVKTLKVTRKKGE